MNKEDLLKYWEEKYKFSKTESTKTYMAKIQSGFFEKYMSGSGIDVGGRGSWDNEAAILPKGILVDLQYPGYDGRILPFSNGSQDWLYSSHCLEHIENYKTAIQEWFRVLKVGGFLVLVLPHQYLYEKKDSKPSQFNGDHKRFYLASSLCKEIEDSLEPNTFRIRHLRENDEGHVYIDSANKHGRCLYEIEICVQKLDPGFSWEKNKDNK